MLTVTHTGLLSQENSYTFAEVFAKRTVTSMEIGTLCTAKLVCKYWYTFLNNHPAITKLRPYQAFFTPIFNRLVTTVGQIDATKIQKHSIQPWFANYDVSVFIDWFIMQEHYENLRLSEAIHQFIQKYNIPSNHIVLPSADWKLLLLSANLILETYYKNAIFPKIFHVYSSKIKFTTTTCLFSTITIAKLLNELDKIVLSPLLLKALNDFKELTIKYKLLPTDEENLVLHLPKIPTYDSYDPFPAFIVLGAMLLLSLINIINMYFISINTAP